MSVFSAGYTAELDGFLERIMADCRCGLACGLGGPSPRWSVAVPEKFSVFADGKTRLRAERIPYFADAALAAALHRLELLHMAGRGGPAATALEKFTVRHAFYRNTVVAALSCGDISRADALRRWLYADCFDKRLVCLVTHSCQLRCRYCRVGKYPAQMSARVLKRAIEFLFTSQSPAVQLQFFGGEPLLRFEMVRRGTHLARRLAKNTGKKLELILTTNGLLLDGKKAEFLKKNAFTVEISCDGTMSSQMSGRYAADGPAAYARLLDGLETARRLGLDYYVIMVVRPERVEHMIDDYKYLAGLGHMKIQLNYALGVEWEQGQMLAFLRQLELLRRCQPGGAQCVNLLSIRREPVVLNSELTVDCDGFLLRETGTCLEDDFARVRERFGAGDIFTPGADMTSLAFSRFDNFRLLAKAYGEEQPRLRRIILSNLKMGRLLEKWSAKHRSC